MKPWDVLVTEVGPTDGLQMVDRVVPTETKTAWITALAEAGLSEIESASFVPPKVLPQFADAGEVAAHALSIPGLSVRVLVPNLKGAQRALQAGARHLSYAFSVTEGHSLSNVRKTREAQLEDFKALVALRDTVPQGERPYLHVGFACVFGCSIEGPVTEDEPVRWAARFAAAGADEIAFCDTVGYANPGQVRRVFKSAREAIGDRLGGIHLHDTRGLGLANALAALDVGVRQIDASLAGLGGCPFAPGATGNIVTEDLVFMLESMGLRTGVDLEKLNAAREIIRTALPGTTLYGGVARAGLPRGFRYGAA